LPLLSILPEGRRLLREGEPMKSHRTILPIILPALALGLLLAVPAAAQHHPVAGKVDYDPQPGGGEPTAPGCPGITNKVTIGVRTFNPDTITVDAGQPVCWTWAGAPEAHNIRADDGSFTSGLPDTTGTFQKTFNTPGSYGFHCQSHGTLTTGMRGTVIVRDNAEPGSGPGTIQLASTEYFVNEADGTLNLAVARVGGSDGPASVAYATAPGSAKPGKDFLPRKGTLRWTAGDAEPKVIAVPLKNDTKAEPEEAFSVKLSKATGAALGAAAAAVTVRDDDGGGGCSTAFSAPSELKAAGESAGEIRLEWEEATGEVRSLFVERRQPDGEFREIAAVAPGADGFVDAGLPAGATFHYRLRAEAADGGSAFSEVVAGATDAMAAACDETRALCLGGRFEATVERSWPAEKGREVTRLQAPEAPDAGLFLLSGAADLQLLVSVFDGCAVNDRYWVSLAAVAEEELTVRVRDTQTGRTWVYFNPAGSMPAPLRDVEAFKTCP
jgi:plastocyanin